MIAVMVMVVLLALATVTEAGLEIGARYLDDTPFDPSTDILEIGESLYLSLYAEGSFSPPHSTDYYWELLCDSSLGTITGGVLGPDAEGECYIYDAWWGDGRAGEFEHRDRYGPGLYADNFLYTAQSAGHATVRLWDLGMDGYLSRITDSVVINQIPEPTTIVLLALGGLLMRRRK